MSSPILDMENINMRLGPSNMGRCGNGRGVHFGWVTIYMLLLYIYIYIYIYMHPLTVLHPTCLGTPVQPGRRPPYSLCTPFASSTTTPKPKNFYYTTPSPDYLSGSLPPTPSACDPPCPPSPALWPPAVWTPGRLYFHLESCAWKFHISGLCAAPLGVSHSKGVHINSKVSLCEPPLLWSTFCGRWCLTPYTPSIWV